MKKQKNLISVLVFTIIATLFVAGCGSHSGDTVKIATGGSSGAYYPLGDSMAQLFERNGISASALETTASVENIRLLKEGEVELAFTQSDIVDYAFKGKEMFEQVGPMVNIQAIASLYNESVHIMASRDRSIQSIKDLKGKRISVGQSGSGTEANARQILEVVDLTFDDFERVERLSLKEAARQIRAGELDAAFFTAAAPMVAINELSKGKNIRLIDLEEEQLARLIEKYPYYTEQTISVDGRGESEKEIKTVAVKMQLVTRAELDEKTVYDITKTLFDHLEELKSGNDRLEPAIALEQALDGITIDIHPGAAKYFEEVGVK